MGAQLVDKAVIDELAAEAALAATDDEYFAFVDHAYAEAARVSKSGSDMWQTACVIFARVCGALSAMVHVAVPRELVEEIRDGGALVP